ncbi:ankyrin repeat-containing domain protein [Aspergillus welwitschiae]|uniref:Ankyrin repeat-containing domain protein n=1 Tax=Aspergillus welwitschiae TaxID=1341132 RepID=A0A3F3QAQ6_9EURO|nr:ankyrin repeat-containing domain protein [Aspergillus welwitschiae]RDH36215.1 ankyrin repeat-containing domain protein [Aspergillus welwitschiae]
MTISATPTPSLWAIAFSNLSEKDRRIFKLPDTSPLDTKQILTEILVALETQRDRCKRDKWTTVSIGGKEIVIRDVCSKIVAYVKKFMEVVDAAVQIDPAHAALPWAGVRFLLQLTFMAFETFGVIVEGLEKATRLIARCGILEALVIRNSSATNDAKVGLEEELVKLYSAVLSFICKAKKHYDGSRMSRRNLPMKPTQLLSVDDEHIERVLSLTSRQSLQDSVKEMEVAEQRVFVMKGLVDSERMENVHGGVSTMLFTIASVVNGVDNIQARLDKAFADLDQPIVRIADEVSDLHVALKESERSELLQWLSTVTIQQHYKEALASVLSGSDALDECNSQQRGIIIHALEEIRRQCRDVVKIFVSSRHEADIAAHFNRGEVSEVTASANEKDLNRFIGIQVESFVQRWFLWVTLQLERICDMERIKDIDSIRQVLTSLPQTLNQSYELLYKRIQDMGEGPRTVALQSLQWLLCAKRKLSVSEFLAAVRKSPVKCNSISARSIIDYCCNLVVIDNVADTFRLAHVTVREFLEENSNDAVLEANLTVSRRCLGTFLWGEFSEDGLLHYATRYWPAHVQQLNGSHQRHEIQAIMTEFFTQEEHFEDWIEHLDERPVEEGYRWSNSLERKLEACFASPPSALFTVSCFGLSEVLDFPEVIEMIDVNQTNRHGTSGVYLAARWGHTGVVRKLLQLGADVNGPGYQYGSPLQAAAFSGHEDIVRILLDSGATFSPTEKGEYSSPLHAALANGHDNIAEVLIDSGLQLVTQKQFADALDTASFKGFTNIVQQLLDGKAGSFTPNICPDPLQVALFGGKARQAKQLLQSCTDINEEKGYFGNALAAAIASRKLALVQLVVDAGARLDARGRFGLPLRAAAITIQLDIATYFLDKGADPNKRDEDLGDPLQAAASFGKLDMMLLLLSHDASVDGCGGHFGTALQAACFNGHEQAARLLIDHGASLDRKGRYRDALQAAVYSGNERIVEILLMAGAKLNPGRESRVYLCSCSERTQRLALPGRRDGTGQLDIPTELGPLEIAARRGDVKLVEKLIAKGAIIDAPDANEEGNDYQNGCAYTALQIAAFWGHLGVVQCLLDRGADIDAIRQTLGTPLQAALEGGHFDVADVLLSRGAGIDKHWAMFGSCLQIFSERGDIKTVEFLLQRGANVEDRGGENGNALQVACNAGHIDIVKLLLDTGADVRSPGRNIGNALQAASLAGHFDIVKLLVHRGIEVDEADGNSETALCLAAKNGDEHMMNFLLQQGAKVDGNSILSGDRPDNLESGGEVERDENLVAIPLHLASVHGHESGVSILLQNGANVHVKGKLRLKETGSSDECDFSKLLCNPLFAACFWGHESIARRLFQYDPWGYAIHGTFTSAVETSLARKKGSIATMLVQEAVRAGFQAEQLDGMFNYACAEGYAGIATQILELCGLERWPDAILVATKQGRSAVVEALLQNGADMNARDAHGNLCLDIAIEKVQNFRHTWWSSNSPNWIEVVRIFLCAGAESNDLPSKIKEIVPDIVQRGSLDAWKAVDRSQYDVANHVELYPRLLFWASETGDLDKIDYVAGKYEPSTGDIKRAVVAAMEGVRNNLPPVEALLRLKTPLFFNDKQNGENDKEPLVLASSEGYSGILSVLLQYAKHSSSIVEEALKTAISRKHVTCTRLILDSQFINPSERLVICSRLIQYCFPFCSGKMLEYLLDQEVSPNTRDPETGETLLYIAATKKDSKGANILISHGADVHLIGGRHGTALHAAAVSGSWKTVESLLSAGADINARGGDYGTPLVAVMAQKWRETCWKAEFDMSCSWECHRCVARVLLEWDADVDAEGEFGTALQAAEKVGNEVGMKMLTEENEVLVEGGEGNDSDFEDSD